jgi:glutamate racemase
MKIVKMHGAANDYVYVDCFDEQPPADPAALAPVIAEVMGPNVRLVSSADETALVTRDALAAAGMLRAAGGAPAERTFLSSGDISWFADLGRRLLGPELRDANEWRFD